MTDIYFRLHIKVVDLKKLPVSNRLVQFRMPYETNKLEDALKVIITTGYAKKEYKKNK